MPAFRAIKVKALTTGLAGGSVKKLFVLTTFPRSFPGLLLNYLLKTMATNPAGGTAYGDLTGTRQFLKVNTVIGVQDDGLEADGSTLVAQTVAQATAVTADQTVADLLALINTAIEGNRNTTAKTASTGTMGLATSNEN